MVQVVQAGLDGDGLVDRVGLLVRGRKRGKSGRGDLVRVRGVGVGVELPNARVLISFCIPGRAG